MDIGGLIGAAAGGIGGFFLGGPPGAVAGAAIGGNIGGGMDANSANAANTAAANNTNWAAFQQNEQFQQQMSSTAHQRDVADLKAAGLNPLLSANAGSSTPSGGGFAGAQVPQVQNVMQGAAATAMQAAQLKVDMAKQISEANLNSELANKANIDAQVARKGIPEAEIKNDLYDIARPAVKWLKDKAESGASKVKIPQPIQQPNMQKMRLY